MSASSSSSSGSGGKELSSFAQSFAAKVAQLVHTDKRTITSLTILADEHRDKASEVVGVLTRRMQQLPSGDHRLPLFYLIDSICQNLGKKGADYPKRIQLHLKPMFDATVKHCSIKVKGSLYRMWNTWRKAHTFNAAPLAEVEAILNAHLTPEERQEALNRPSAAATAAQQADPRKRAAPGAAASPSPSASPSGSPAYGQEPSVKKAKLQDPRRPPVAAATALSTEAAALDTILSSVDVQSRVSRDLLERMRLQLRQPMAEPESKALIVTLVQELQQAMNMQPAAAALPAPPRPPLPATLPPPLPIPATLPPLPAMPLQPFPMQPAMPPIGMPMAPAPLPLPMQPHPFAGFAPPVSAPPAWNQQPPVQPPVHASPPAAAMGRTPVRAEPRRPITFSEEDIRTRHSFLVPSLYESIPFQCKTCGRRIHNSGEMTSHLDWHFKMHKRAATIAKTGGGVRSQNWYWDEAEWVAAEDVIFGVQKRAATGAAAANKGAGGATGAAGGDDAGAKPAPQSVPADELQKKCSMCGEEFRTEWSDEDESWMFRDCQRITPALVADALAHIQQLEAAAPMTEAAAALEPGSAQAVAHGAKEEERVTALYRWRKVLAHVQQHQGRIIHQACHNGLIANIMKSKRPEDAPSAANTATTTPPEQKEKATELPALE